MESQHPFGERRGTICARWYRDGAPVSGAVGGAAERAGVASSFQQADREAKSRSLRLDARLLRGGKVGINRWKAFSGDSWSLAGSYE